MCQRGVDQSARRSAAETAVPHVLCCEEYSIEEPELDEMASLSGIKASFVTGRKTGSTWLTYRVLARRSLRGFGCKSKFISDRKLNRWPRRKITDRRRQVDDRRQDPVTSADKAMRETLFEDVHVVIGE